MDRKHHKRHRGASPSDNESRSKKHHKHHHEKEKSGRHNSSDEEDDRRSRRHKKQHHHRDRDYDPDRKIKQEKDEENFSQQQRERSQHDHQRRENRRDRDRQGGDFGMNTETKVKTEEGEEDKTEEEKQKPNFELSGKLTEDTNTFRGVVIKYNEPPEAMMPKRKWRLYPFKGETSLPVLHIHRQSAFLLGRDRRIADIPVDHPSCSKQQAALQFRAMPYTRPDGSSGRRVRPYIIDLESANGTYVNGEKIEAKRYYELKEKDVIKFGFSTREYVVLHDSVDTSELGVGEDMEEA
ncbi:smad nuclear-interacting protein 1 isoform X2 [Aplysia californica]|uniref:Smad nuclear-interacting protein 1 isoform X2 n=1 Tax=Aplysia californica TaxID=6500 RepID=A0ABM0JPQ8_APLCA|nr:smad nuclear-interacting protein 1 isoform X2 [Aplysia californica]